MVEQISVFIDNRPGRLAELCNIIGRNGVDIRALQLVEAGEFGLVRMITDNNEKQWPIETQVCLLEKGGIRCPYGG